MAERSRGPREMNVAAVAFDIDHTLGIDNKLERVVFLRLLDDITAAGGAAKGTLAEESENIDRLLAEQRKGALSIDGTVKRFVAERGVRDSASFVDRYKRMAIDSVEHFFAAQPDARKTLQELTRRRIPLAILSNGWSPLQQRKAECVSFPGSVLVSDEVGAAKPQRDAFFALATALKTDPATVAYVGDNPWTDVDAAKRAGMLGIWVDAEGLRYPSDCASPDAVIHRLTELLAIL